MFQPVNYLGSWQWIPSSQGLLSRMVPPAPASFFFLSLLQYSCWHVNAEVSPSPTKQKSSVHIHPQRLQPSSYRPISLLICQENIFKKLTIHAFSIPSPPILSWTHSNQVFYWPSNKAALIKVAMTSTLPGSVAKLVFTLPNLSEASDTGHRSLLRALSSPGALESTPFRDSPCPGVPPPLFFARSSSSSQPPRYFADTHFFSLLPVFCSLGYYPSFKALNTIHMLEMPKCKFPMSTAPLNSKLIYLKYIFPISTKTSNCHVTLITFKTKYASSPKLLLLQSSQCQ